MPKWSKLINTRFIPLVKNRSRYLILIGSRGSSKSDFAAKKLIRRCLTEKFFRYILYRKTYNTIKDSQFQNIKDIIHEWGLQSLFKFSENPLQITCVNGNKFICRGGDDPKKLKSIKDPTGVWYEEEIPPEADFITITTSIRTKKAEYLQELFSVNPEVDGDYRKHWFWRRFFGQQINKEADEWDTVHPEGSSFDGLTEIKVPAVLDKDGNIVEQEKMVSLDFTVHHSTWRDNKWIPDSFKAMLLDLARTNPYYSRIYADGFWGNKSTDGNSYKRFNRNKNVIPRTDIRAQYNPEQALHLTFDFNVNPYVTLCIHQVVGTRAVQIDEICLSNPKNSTPELCREFERRYRGHIGGVFVYGDPAGRQEDTRTEKGTNDFTLIAKELAIFRPQMRYEIVAPPVVMRIQWLNDVFADNTGGLELLISDKCTNTIADYENLKEAADGTKAKIKVKNKETGVSFEQYGHTSDANDYFYCRVFYAQFNAYQKTGTMKKVRTGTNVSKNSW